MKFKIGKRNYLIKFNDLSMDLYELKKVENKESKNYGTETEVLIGFFKGFEGIYKELVKRHLSAKDKTILSFEDVLREINKVSKVLDSLLIYKNKGEK